MDKVAGTPVTISIKAPNQRLGDQTVECFLDWSVLKLKNHLANVYPSKPNAKTQRIIYSGKLLKDNLLLKDVLRMTDTTLQQHTIHLVCSPTPEELLQTKLPSSEMKRETSSPVPTPAAASPTSQDGASSRRQSTPVEPTLPSTSGLRHRTVSTPSFSNYYPYNYGNYQYGQRANQQGFVMANQQQQAYWMQHMYAQQMAQYMQYSNQFAAGGAGLPANLPPVHAPVGVPQPQVPDQPVVLNAPVAPNVAGPDQNVRMNAGLGPAVDDNDDENAHRDWLDYIYTFCRFVVLLSLVYFYSSLSRFLMVTGLMIFMFMYQKRWFRLRRTPIARERLEEHRNPEQGDGALDNNNESNQEQQPEQQLAGDNAERDSTSESQEEGETDSDSTETAPPETPKPGVLAIMWIFVSTFFTSLFPQDPNAIAGN
ncbi:homocysteine-responsive endoplasmic reticulum-resident ubiquitin-like domain member 2 protein isoform X1 [Asterias amurensis]|uniref:homocysteine-responsive endoplasmic reticulum-resident ubiquitin-like domain member 2 protein isoform X1 n=1 Tax=Asterias amurensis TaxID=7602 RepID=UPI003AB87AB4